MKLELHARGLGRRDAQQFRDRPATLVELVDHLLAELARRAEDHDALRLGLTHRRTHASTRTRTQV